MEFYIVIKVQSVVSLGNSAEAIEHITTIVSPYVSGQ